MMKAVRGASSQNPVRGEGLLRRLEGLILRLDGWIERGVGVRMNPLAQTGAIANLTFLVALVSGILLLIWYRPSVHHAYLSVESMAAWPWTGQWLRSLHRYSSDACLFFVILHASRLFLARRFIGARWWAWVTGLVAVGVLWLVGWVGYWLVWDGAAQQVAVGTAKMLDLVPVFSEPLTRTFLTDEGISSLFFFVVFFVHMLTPMGIGILLWLHISRVSRAMFLTARPMTLWVVGVLLVVSRLFPVSSGPAAEMAVQPAGFAVDGWFLLALTLTDRLSGGALWGVLIVGGALLITLPWTLRRGDVVTAIVNTDTCNGCTLCAHDCPYDAITMIPRMDGRKYELQARVHASKCVGCGICVGSCDPGSIALSWLPNQPTRVDIDAWVDKTLLEGGNALLAFLCSGSAASDFEIDPETGTCRELEGYRVLAVPCAGWVQRLMLERALRRGAEAILIVGCGGSEPAFREGSEWTRQRLVGERKPALRRDKIEGERVVFVHYSRTDRQDLIDRAKVLREDVAEGRFLAGVVGSGVVGSGVEGEAAAITTKVQKNGKPYLSPLRRVVSGVVIAGVLSAVVVGGSRSPYLAPGAAEPELIVSFKHHGVESEACREVSEAEQAQVPKHMRRATICERARADVRLRVFVDEVEVLSRRYSARGVQRDGPALGLESVFVTPGRRVVRVELGDTHDVERWDYQTTREVGFERGRRQVVVMESVEGFVWH